MRDPDSSSTLRFIRFSPFRSGIRSLLALAIAFALALAALTGVLAQVLGPSGPAGPSPATGHASVVAQGVIDIPAGALSWNVTTQTADVSQGPVTIEQPGFVVANRSPILVIDTAAETKTRLAAGEALHVRAGQELAFETFGAPDTFILISLLPDGAEPAEGAALYASSSFDMDAGERDTDLIRDVVASGEASGLQMGAAPTLVLVTNGAAIVGTLNGDTRLSAGTAATFEGPLTISGDTNGATFYAAFIGASLVVEGASPVDATPVATATEVPTEPATQMATTPEVIPGGVLESGTPTGEATVAPTEDEPAADTPTTDPELDTDDDGIPDVNEVAIGTDPNNLDTDGDLLYDGGELVYGTNPLNPDSDGDGLSDGEEVYINLTDPANADSDGDGVNDYNEVQNGTDPLDAADS
jgi:hypothetical protein